MAINRSALPAWHSTYCALGLLLLISSCSDSALRRLEQARFSAQIARDSTVLERDLHTDLLYIHSHALAETKAEFIQSACRGKIEYLLMQSLDTSRIERCGRLALVDGQVRVEGRYEGSPFAMKLRYTSVYKRHNFRWQLLRWQSTKINP